MYGNCRVCVTCVRVSVCQNMCVWGVCVCVVCVCVCVTTLYDCVVSDQ